MAEEIGKWLSRTECLFGREAMRVLSRARVAVLGLGGVGGSAAEALCRSGIGHLLLIDNDTIDETNLNRQLFATRGTIGQVKTQAALERLCAINPDGDFTGLQIFYEPDHDAALFDWKPDYIIDAIDTVSAKLHLIAGCAQRGVPLLCCLGTGNRTDPSQLRIGDIRETANGCGCGLARVMRRELRRAGITKQRVLYSLEQPRAALAADSPAGRHSPASCAFVPPAAGMLLASYAVRELLSRQHSTAAGAVPQMPVTD